MPPKRRIRRSSGCEACWKDRSKYGTTPGVDAIASSSEGRISAGCRYDTRTRSMPSTAASSGSIVSSSRRSPRSLPYDVEFSLTRNSSRTPCSPSQRASVSTSAGRRDRNAPRNAGIAQNAQRRSQPEAIFSGAQGRPSSRRRSTRGPEAGASPSGRSGALAWPGTATDSSPAASCRLAGVSGSSVRRSRGTCEAGRSPCRMASRWADMSA